MDERQIIEALITRADDDAQAFRRSHPDDVPTELWIDNSYTAALPLVAADLGFHPGPGPHSDLFAAYRREIRKHLGERPDGRDSGSELPQLPTPGEH